MEIIGTLIHLLPMSIVGENNLKKQTIVVQSGDDKDATSLVIDFRWRMAEDLAGVKVGDEVAVSYKARHSEYQGRFYNSLKGVSISPLRNNSLFTSDDNDDLPF